MATDPLEVEVLKLTILKLPWLGELKLMMLEELRLWRVE